MESGTEHIGAARPVEEIRSQLLSNSIRKAVDRAVRNGLKVTWNTTGSSLSVFQELYDRSVERWARRQHEPLSLSRWRMGRATRAPTLAATARCMAGLWRMGVVEIGGQPAAAAIVFIEPGGNANGFRMAMDADLVGRSGAGYLVQVAALEEASRAGCRFFHLGESGQAEGLSSIRNIRHIAAVNHSPAGARAEVGLRGVPGGSSLRGQHCGGCQGVVPPWAARRGGQGGAQSTQPVAERVLPVQDPAKSPAVP